jgi:hypothetical protein
MLKKVIYVVLALALLGFIMHKLDKSGTKPFVRKHTPEAF